VSVSDIVDAVVLNLDIKNKRISLGMKQVETNPWDIIVEKYPVGTNITGQIRNLTDFGAFVGLDEGVDGLIHISDMSWTRRVKHPSEILKKGEDVEAVVLQVDKNKERLSLGLKQMSPDPWINIKEKYPIDSVVTGKVVKITDFGVFVALDNGIEGLIHVSEVSLEPNARVEELLTINSEIKALVVKIDEEERKIGLSIKKYLEGLAEDELKKYMGDQEAMRATMGDLMKQESQDEPSSETVSDESSEESPELSENPLQNEKSLGSTNGETGAAL
jgi:small subunit ribosomal protein S1